MSNLIIIQLVSEELKQTESILVRPNEFWGSYWTLELSKDDKYLFYDFIAWNKYDQMWMHYRYDYNSFKIANIFEYDPDTSISKWNLNPEEIE